MKKLAHWWKRATRLSVAGMLFVLSQAGMAATISVQDAGAGGSCSNAWPPAIVGNYTENGTLNSAPRYDSPAGWYVYRVNIWGLDNWVVSNTPGSDDYNDGTIAFYQASSAATPPLNSSYTSTNSACGKINLVAGAGATPPSAPTIYNLNSGMPPYISGGSTTVGWSAVTGAIGYKLDVATDAAFTAFVTGYNAKTITDTPTPPTFTTVSGLNSPGTTYYFRVRAYNGVGDSSNSATLSTTSVPAAPTATAASAVAAQQFQANWGAQAGADAYALQVCTDAGFTSCLAGYNPYSESGTSATVSGLTAATTYHYRLRASNVNGSSAYSNSITVTTNARPALGGTFTTAGAVNDNATIAPFSGVTVSDANGDNVSVSIAYTAANGTLSGTGLTGAAGNYVLSAAAPATVTARLQALVFTPTLHQGAPGSTVTTTFTLTPSDGTDAGSANASTVVTTTMSNVAPAFVGAGTSLTVYANSGANDIKSLLHASDPDASQTLTWSVHTAPAHGTLTLSGTTAAAGGADITPGGSATYTPTASYSGPDSFTVQVGDGMATTTRSIGVTVAMVIPDAPTIGAATAGDAQASVAFTPPAFTGGSPITGYTATSNPGGITGTGVGSPVTVTGLTNGTAYTFTVTATNGIGTGPASAASNSVTPKAAQTITFAAPSPQNFGTSPTLTASASSPLTVTFSSQTTAICTITAGGALTFVSAGTCTIDADQPGNAVYSAAPTVSRSFTVNAVAPAAPVIGTATAGNAQASVTFTLPASNGGASITGYTATSNPGGITGTSAGSPVTVTGLTNGTDYTFTVTATNGIGTGPASAASNSVTPKAAQTITFSNPGAQNFGTSPTLTASTSSTLTVTFSSSTTGVCTITAGGALTFVTTGTCIINADQPGNAVYSAASTVSRAFGVNAVVPAAPTIGTATAGDTQASVTVTPPAFTGGASITGYTATSNPGNITGTSAGSPVTVTGLTNGVAYTFTVTASNSAGTGPASAASNSVTPKAAQTITFADPGPQNFGTTPTLTASASSSLTVAFSSSTTGVCTITAGGALTFVTAGVCIIDADQPGNAVFGAAPTVSRSFTVNAVVPAAPVIGTATAGNAQASVTFTPPAFTGGSPITGYTVTSNPGGITGTGAGSPVTVTGLTNGTAYTFTVTATNGIGTGPASAASNSVTPLLNGACGPANGVPTGFVPATAQLCAQGTAGAVLPGSPWNWTCHGSGGGIDAACAAPNAATATGSGLARAVIAGGTWSLDAVSSSGFIPTSGHPKSPPSLPPEITFPHGLLDFVLTAGAPGTAATLTITYPAALPPGTAYWKYGPTPAGHNCTGPACALPHWYRMPPAQAVVAGNTITLTIFDGGVGDDDLLPNGIIVDQGGPGVPGGALGIPSLSQWGVVLLAGLLGLLGLLTTRPARRSPRP